jgi:hypothetical protein
MSSMQRSTLTATLARPLCVDLDGTLVRTDTLIEALLQLIRQNPLVLFLMPGWPGNAQLANRSRAAGPVRRL